MGSQNLRFPYNHQSSDPPLPPCQPNGSSPPDLTILTQFAHHRQGVARLNNGSFGSCPASVQAVQAQWQQRWLEQPDELYFGPLQQALTASRHAVASLICARHPHELCLLDNLTTAAAIVAQDIAWAFTEGHYPKGDLILLLSSTYPAVRKCFQAYAVRAGAEIMDIEILLPVNAHAEIFQAFEEALDRARRSGKTVRLAVLDHISSMPSVAMPIAELVRLCRVAGVERVFVDGAHAAGNVAINVQEIDADYYAGNLHKWFFAPTPACFLHCKPQHLDRLHHPVVSHNYGKGLLEECAWVGTRDYSPLLAITAALDFVDQVLRGAETLMDHNHRAVVEMGEMLASAWGTECGTVPELSSAMIMVALPPELNIRSHEDGLQLRTRLRVEFSVEVPIYFQEKRKAAAEGSPSAAGVPFFGSKAYVRISHQVYNRVDDYYKLRDAVNFLVSNVGGDSAS